MNGITMAGRATTSSLRSVSSAPAGGRKITEEKGIGLREDVVAKVGVREQAAIAIADLLSFLTLLGTNCE